MPWDQDDIDNDMFRDYDEDDCDHQFADIDILEGRGHCPFCGHTWYLTCEEIQAEAKHQAEYALALEEEMSVDQQFSQEGK